MNRGSLLFISDSNSTRGQMAEGFAKKHRSDGVQVFSAALNPAKSIDPLTVEIMGEFGIDLSPERPKQIRDLSDQRFDLAIQLDHIDQSKQPVLAG